MKKAGAYGTCVFSDTKYSVVKEQKTAAVDLVALFPEADLILLEGMKDSGYPKIEVIGPNRSAGEDSPAAGLHYAADPSTVLAYVRGREEDGQTLPYAARVFQNTDIGGICEVILQYADMKNF